MLLIRHVRLLSPSGLTTTGQSPPPSTKPWLGPFTSLPALLHHSDCHFLSKIYFALHCHCHQGKSYATLDPSICTLYFFFFTLPDFATAPPCRTATGIGVGRLSVAVEWKKSPVSQIADIATTTTAGFLTAHTRLALGITSRCNRYVPLAVWQPRIATTRPIPTSQWRFLCAPDRRTRVTSLVSSYSPSTCANCGRFDCPNCWKLEKKKTQTCLQSLNVRRPQLPPAYRHR